MFSKKFWVDALERAVKTAAQTTVAVLAGAVTFSDLATGWDEALFLIGVATLTSVLMSVASSQVGSPEDASLVNGGGGE